MPTNLHSTMLLLILNGVNYMVTGNYNLHSTMLLLIHNLKNILKQLNSIYIPLCFYLYASCDSRYPGRNRIYIPLCFYLYGPWLRSSQTVLSFTFHYASTYTILQTGIEIIGKYLHSTMLLLILRRQNSIKSFKIIYIPLCFYLYLPVRTWEMHILLYLHSTMLLLIPIPDILHLPTNNIFTFHYASTYTDLT